MTYLASLANKLGNKVGGLLGAAGICAWMGTLDYQAAFYDPSVDPAAPDCKTPAIYLFWHEYILVPIHLRGHNGIVLLLSQHRDAELLSRAAFHLGYGLVRGSTYRGALTAVRELLREGATKHLSITPDGPRGPRRRMAQGPLYLSSKLGLPLVLMGFGFDRPWRMNSWDRFALPRPYSRARAVLSERIQIPPDLDRTGLEYYRERTERLLDRLTDEAEAWAAAGTAKIGQIPCRRQAAAPRTGRAAPADTPALLKFSSLRETSPDRRAAG